MRRNAGDPNVSAQKAAGDLNDLHELLSDKVLGAVPNGAVRDIQEQNLSTVRGQLEALGSNLDGALGALSAADFATSRVDSSDSQQFVHSQIAGQAAALERNAEAEQAEWANDARIAQQHLAAAAQAMAIESQGAHERAMQSSYTSSYDDDYDRIAEPDDHDSTAETDDCDSAAETDDCDSSAESDGYRPD